MEIAIEQIPTRARTRLEGAKSIISSGLGRLGLTGPVRVEAIENLDLRSVGGVRIIELVRQGNYRLLAMMGASTADIEAAIPVGRAADVARQIEANSDAGF